MALVPLDRVLLAFDDLSDYPASRAVNAEHHELEAFVFMLVDLGLIPNRTTVTLSRCELADLSEWFAQHCRVAVDFWRYAFAHIYSNAREMAGSAEAWLERLKAVRFAAGGPGSAWVLYVRHLEGHTLRAPKVDEGHFFEWTGPLGVASFVELYLELHPDRERLLENATRCVGLSHALSLSHLRLALLDEQALTKSLVARSTNRTPRLPLLENSLAKYEPGARSSRCVSLSLSSSPAASSLGVTDSCASPHAGHPSFRVARARVHEPCRPSQVAFSPRSSWNATFLAHDVASRLVRDKRRGYGGASSCAPAERSRSSVSRLVNFSRFVFPLSGPSPIRYASPRIACAGPTVVAERAAITPVRRARTSGRSPAHPRSIACSLALAPCFPAPATSLLSSSRMAEHRLYVHGPTHEPFNPHALDEAQALVDFPPDEALQAWYHEPAATALQRYRDGHVEMHKLSQQMYYDPEQRWSVLAPPLLFSTFVAPSEPLFNPRCRSWKQDVLKINEVSSGNAGQAHNGTFWAKIECVYLAFLPLAALCLTLVPARSNWFALVPLPLVLQAFDRLYNEPPSPSVDLKTHQVEAFALLLLNLGIDPGTTAASASAEQLLHLTRWLESDCSQAVDFWLALYTHVYHNARTAAGSTPWATRLQRLDLGQESGAWTIYLRHVESGVYAAHLPSMFARASCYFSNFVAPELLLSLVFTDLYLTLHPHKQRPPFSRVTRCAPLLRVDEVRARSAGAAADLRLDAGLARPRRRPSLRRLLSPSPVLSTSRRRARGPPPTARRRRRRLRSLPKSGPSLPLSLVALPLGCSLYNVRAGVCARGSSGASAATRPLTRRLSLVVATSRFFCSSPCRRSHVRVERDRQSLQACAQSAQLKRE